MSMEERPSPMLMCVFKYNISHVNAEEETYELSRQTDYSILKKINIGLDRAPQKCCPIAQGHWSDLLWLACFKQNENNE